MRPKADLLLASLAVSCAASRVQLMHRTIAPEVDPQWLIDAAVWHGVAPQVYRSLSAIAHELLPAAAMNKLRMHSLAHRLNARHLAEQLVCLMDALDSAGIPALAFKGPVLGAIAYGDESARQFVDLDILIGRDRLPDAVKVLAEHGYSGPAGDSAALGAEIFQDREEEFHNRNDFTSIDLHWQLTPGYFQFLDHDALFARSIRVNLSSGSVATLAPADMMIYLCVHGSLHGWRSLRMICDAAAMAQTLTAAELAAVVVEAERTGTRRMVLLGLALANQLLGLDLSEAIASSINDSPAIGRLVAEVRRVLFTRIGHDPDFETGWMIPFRTIEGARKRITFWALRALSPTLQEWELMPLPRSLFPLYYALRPAHLAARYVCAAVRVAGAGPKLAGIRN